MDIFLSKVGRIHKDRTYEYRGLTVTTEDFGHPKPAKIQNLLIMGLYDFFLKLILHIPKGKDQITITDKS